MNGFNINININSVKLSTSIYVTSCNGTFRWICTKQSRFQNQELKFDFIFYRFQDPPLFFFQSLVLAGKFSYSPGKVKKNQPHPNDVLKSYILKQKEVKPIHWTTASINKQSMIHTRYSLICNSSVLPKMLKLINISGSRQTSMTLQ